MPGGTPGFVGARLREAREARGITAIALAELLGVTPGTITQYEGGAVTPRPEVTESIAVKLNLPVHFFLRPTSAPEEATVFYRSMSSATKAARTRAARRLTWFQEIIGVLDEWLDFPAAQIPSLDVPTDPTKITNDQIEAAAIFCRQAWGLGDRPLGNSVQLIESKGVLAMRETIGADTLDALSKWSTIDSRPYMVLGADKGSAVRSRFDACHELGHLLLHRNVAATALVKNAEFKQLEDQAHRFAGAFMLPASSFTNDVYLWGLDALRPLKPKWGASIGLMIKRLSDLEVMPESESRRLWINYARRGWNRWEPMDDEIPVEMPTVPRLAIDELAGDFDLQSLANEFPVNADEAERMLGLPELYLRGGPQVLQIPRRDRPVDPGQENSAMGQLIPFRRK